MVALKNILTPRLREPLDEKEAEGVAAGSAGAGRSENAESTATGARVAATTVARRRRRRAVLLVVVTPREAPLYRASLFLAEALLDGRVVGLPLARAGVDEPERQHTSRHILPDPNHQLNATNRE